MKHIGLNTLIFTAVATWMPVNARAQSAAECFSDPARVEHFAMMHAARVVKCRTFPEIAAKYAGTPMSVDVLPYKTHTPACRQLAVEMSWAVIRKAQDGGQEFCEAAVKAKYSQ